MSFLEELPKSGALVVPCQRPPHGSLTVRPSPFAQPHRRMRCGHLAWVHESIVTPSGYIVRTLHTPAHAPLSRLHIPFLGGDAEAQCTVCTLGEKLTYAAVCAWCGEIIFPGDAATLTYDDSHIIERRIPYVQALWKDPREKCHRVVVCNRHHCRQRANHQRLMRDARATSILTGTWNTHYTLVVAPR